MKKIRSIFFIITLFVACNTVSFSSFALTDPVDQATEAIEKQANLFWKNVKEVWNFKITTIDKQPITVSKIVVAIILLIIGFAFAKRLSRIIEHKLLPTFGVETSVAASFQTLIYYLLLLLVTILVLYIVNVPLTLFTLLGGALAIGIGFGSQNIVSNFISGLILIFERPIKVGDMIEVENVSGMVEKIGARSTRIRTFHNIHLIVPNSFFLEKNVVNWTLSDDLARIFIRVSVPFGTSTRDVTKLLRKVAGEHGKILKDPEPVILFSDFGDTSLKFEVHFWIKMRNVMERKMIESDVRYLIESNFKESGIPFSASQREVNLNTDHPIKISMINP